MGDPTDLKIPVRRIRVELCLAGQAARRVDLFLGERGERDWNRPEVLDLVEGHRQFLPCRDGELGTWTIINRDHIVWLAVPLHELRSTSPEEGTGFGLLYDHRRQVKLQLNGGLNLEGAILYSAPAEHARLMDHVNQTGSFLVLHWSDQILMVRKSAIVEIVEASAGPGGQESR